MHQEPGAIPHLGPKGDIDAGVLVRRVSALVPDPVGHIDGAPVRARVCARRVALGIIEEVILNPTIGRYHECVLAVPTDEIADREVLPLLPPPFTGTVVGGGPNLEALQIERVFHHDVRHAADAVRGQIRHRRLGDLDGVDQRIGDGHEVVPPQLLVGSRQIESV